MTWPDLVNGSFELCAGLFCLLNVRNLLRDRSVRGVSVPASAFFAVWGYWNLFYYPHLGQWASLAGGIVVTVVNTTWVALALWFGARERKAK